MSYHIQRLQQLAKDQDDLGKAQKKLRITRKEYEIGETLTEVERNKIWKPIRTPLLDILTAQRTRPELPPPAPRLLLENAPPVLNQNDPLLIAEDEPVIGNVVDATMIDLLSLVGQKDGTSPFDVNLTNGQFLVNYEVDLPDLRNNLLTIRRKGDDEPKDPITVRIGDQDITYSKIPITNIGLGTLLLPEKTINTHGLIDNIKPADADHYTMLVNSLYKKPPNGGVQKGLKHDILYKNKRTFTDLEDTTKAKPTDKMKASSSKEPVLTSDIPQPPPPPPLPPPPLTPLFPPPPKKNDKGFPQIHDDLLSDGDFEEDTLSDSDDDFNQIDYLTKLDNQSTAINNLLTMLEFDTDGNRRTGKSLQSVQKANEKLLNEPNGLFKLYKKLKTPVAGKARLQLGEEEEKEFIKKYLIKDKAFNNFISELKPGSKTYTYFDIARDVLPKPTTMHDLVDVKASLKKTPPSVKKVSPEISSFFNSDMVKNTGLFNKIKKANEDAEDDDVWDGSGMKDKTKQIGNLKIDMKALVDKNVLKCYSKNGHLLMNKSCDKCMVDILTKGFNPNRKYSDKTKEMYQTITKISGSGHNKTSSIGVFSSADELVDKLELIIGSKNAGNTSREMLNEGVLIIDALLKHRKINKEDHKKLYNLYFK